MRHLVSKHCDINFAAQQRWFRGCDINFWDPCTYGFNLIALWFNDSESMYLVAWPTRSLVKRKGVAWRRCLKAREIVVLATSYLVVQKPLVS